MPAQTIASQERIRVSCLASARIRHPDDPTRFALLENRNYRTQLGQRKLTPVGGKLTIPTERRATLPKGSRFETKHNSNDLRFSLPVNELDMLLQWFMGRNRAAEHEADMMSEIFDELGPAEHGPLTLAELEGTKATFAGYQLQVMDSLKLDVVGDPRTAYFNKVYDVTLPEASLRKLAHVALDSDSPVFFVTPDEIRNDKVNNSPGVSIGRTSLVLLDPLPKITLPDLRARS